MPEDAPSPPDEDHRSFLSWVLVVATALPLGLAAAATRTWFSGIRDGQFFAYDPATDLTPGVASVSFADRWASFDNAVPYVPALLAATLGVVVLAGVTVHGRPRWLQPSAAARATSVVLATLSGLAALAVVVSGVVAVATDPVTTSSGGQVRASTSADLVAPLGVGLLTAVVCAFAAVLLAHRPVEPSTVDATPEPAAEPEPAPEPEPATERIPEPPAPDFPRAGPDDLARYRPS